MWPRSMAWTIGALAALTMLAGSTTALAAPAPVRVKVNDNISLGSTILVDGKGRPLYRFATEKRGKIECVGRCARNWLPLTVPEGATVLAGSGVTATRLGVVKRPDGRLQVTYAGFGLYRYKGDVPNAVAAGQGIGTAWYVINPAGRLVKKTPVGGYIGEKRPNRPPDLGYSSPSQIPPLALQDAQPDGG